MFMSVKTLRLGQAARKFNVGKDTIVDVLKEEGCPIDNNTNAKLDAGMQKILARTFASSAHDKEEAHALDIGNGPREHLIIDADGRARAKKSHDENILIKDLSNKDVTKAEETKAKSSAPRSVSLKARRGHAEFSKASKPSYGSAPKLRGIKVVGKVDLAPPKKASPAPQPSQNPGLEDKPNPPKAKEDVIRGKSDVRLRSLKVIDKIEVKDKTTPERSDKKKRVRKRFTVPNNFRRKHKKESPKDKQAASKALDEKQIKENIKNTLAKMSQASQARIRTRREKSVSRADKPQGTTPGDKKILNVTEFVSVNDLALLMDISVNELIKTCLDMGLFVSINQRLDAESITLLADEHGFEVRFTSMEEEVQKAPKLEDNLADDTPRAPIVTIMGHVDHGKTSLLDFIRKTRVSEQEAGGITQHIGAYQVETKTGAKIVFLDTPGHAAFTAMRARGARLTDVAVIVIAADDDIMPQTEEAINHVKVAGVPFVIAINKIDKANAQPDKIRESLSKRNILIEEWGGKYQCQEVSAKTGKGIDLLLEKVLLEAELLELKANAKKRPAGTVIEATLDKGKGYVATILVQNGTLNVGDTVLAGANYGKVKAIFSQSGARIKSALPATPVQILGLDAPPQAGDHFQWMEGERDARELANKRKQILREQSNRTKKHITLDEIKNRSALDSFQEFNIIIKGDVDGSVEALADALQKLSSKEVQVNVLHKAVGQISESDVLLASASNALIIGFQVRPSVGAKKLAEREQIEIRIHSVIFETINEMKSAIEGMLAPKIEDVVTAQLKVLQTFKISKVGIIAGCKVEQGHIKFAQRIRLIRDGVVAHDGAIAQLKRFKEDVQDVKAGQECGLMVKNYSDIQSNDVIEAYDRQEIKRKFNIKD